MRDSASKRWQLRQMPIESVRLTQQLIMGDRESLDQTAIAVEALSGERGDARLPALWC